MKRTTRHHHNGGHTGINLQQHLIEKHVISQLEKRLQEHGWQTLPFHITREQGQMLFEIDLVAYKRDYLLLFEHKHAHTDAARYRARQQLTRDYHFYDGDESDGRNVRLLYVWTDPSTLRGYDLERVLPIR